MRTKFFRPSAILSAVFKKSSPAKQMDKLLQVSGNLDSRNRKCSSCSKPNPAATNNDNPGYVSSFFASSPQWVEPFSDIADFDLKPSPWVEKVCNILENHNPNSVHSALDEFCFQNSIRLSPHFVTDVLRTPTVQKFPKVALGFFNWAARQEGFSHNLASYVALIESLGAMKDAQGIHVVAEILKSRSFRNPNLTGPACNILLKNFGKFGMAEEALGMWRAMQEQGIRSDIFTYNCLIDALVNDGSVEKAERILEVMSEGRVEVGIGIRPNVVTYNIIIKGVCKDGRVEEAMGYLRQMKEKKHCFPDEITYVTLMQAFHREGRFDRTLSLFLEMSEGKLRIPPHAYNLVICGLCNEGKVYEACRALDGMVGRGCTPNLAIYTALIDAHFKIGDKEKALRFLEQIQERRYDLDKVTCSTVINGLCKVGEVDKAQEFLVQSEELGLDVNAFSYCAIIDGLGKAGKIEEAEKVFREMPKRECAQDVFCFNAIIDGLCKAVEIDKAMGYLRVMEKAGCDPTVYTYTILIDGFFKVHKSEAALKLWYEMIDRGIAPTAVSFRTLSTGLCLSGKVTIACRILDEMVTMGVVPDTAYADMINVLCKAGRVKQACKLADGIIDRGREIPGKLRCAFINSLRKAGNADLAFKMVHSRIGIGYNRSGRIKRRIKFRTLLEPDT